MSKGGFTLLECLLVLVLIALLLPPLSALFTTAHRIGAAGSKAFYGGIAAQNALESLRGHRLPLLHERISEGIPSCSYYNYVVTWHGFVGMTYSASRVLVVFSNDNGVQRGYIQGPGAVLPLYFEVCKDPETTSLRFVRTQGGLMAEYTKQGKRHQRIFPAAESIGIAVVLTQKRDDVPVQFHISYPESDSMQISFYDDTRIRPEVVLNINGTSHTLDQKWYGGDVFSWAVFPGDGIPALYPLVTVEAFAINDPKIPRGRRTGILPTKP